MTGWARVLVAVAGLGLLAPACSATSGSGSPKPPVVSDLTESGNGQTVHIAVGSKVRVTLHSTYWRFARDEAPGVLRRTSLTTAANTDAPRVPGSGRGTVVADFEAVSIGSATIRASRTTCGEALRCVGGQGSYRLTVVVS